MFVEYEYLKWEKMLAAKNDCLIHQTEPEQESITESWNQRNASRNKAQITNSGPDFSTGSVSLSIFCCYLMLGTFLQDLSAQRRWK